MTYTQKQLLWISLLTGLISGCSNMPMSYNAPPVEQRAPQQSGNNNSAPAAQPSTAPEESQSAPPATTQAVPVPATPTEMPVKPQSPAVLALLNDAQQKQQQGDLSSAQVTLQRAQRIAPRDPAVYYALAETHLQLKDYELAEQVALKGVSLVQGNRTQLHKFWSLIANIRTQAGNAQGAAEARKMADKY